MDKLLRSSKAYSGAAMAGLTTYLACVQDGSLNQSDVHLIIAAVLGGFGLVYRVPNKA